MSTTMTRAETAIIRIDEPGGATLDDLVHDLTDISRLASLVERMAYGDRLAFDVPSVARVVAMRYGSPLEVILAVGPPSAAVFAALAVVWERVTAGIRNLAEASLKRAEARKMNADADRQEDAQIRAHLRQLLGDDIGQQFDHVVPDEDLVAVVDLFLRLAGRNVSIDVDR